MISPAILSIPAIRLVGLLLLSARLTAARYRESNRVVFRDVIQVGGAMGAWMRMRPEAEQKQRAGFQRGADEQSGRYAAELAHAGDLAARFGCGEVIGVFSAQAGGDIRPRTYV